MKKILVVDNHPVLLKFMADMLTKKGYQVKTAQDGLSALDVLKDYIPDIMFVDLNEIIEQTSETFGRTKKEIIIHRDLAEDLLKIRADQSQIEQVLWNLYINAWQAMPGDGKGHWSWAGFGLLRYQRPRRLY